ncbi:MAG: bifunctional diguanylate cyclase/phosphodiesterase [Lachnospiraceae bacterium]|jgi:diguanylate cyclase (GGDEF)-like protein|nr:bifunctional diguanylate cyclase/phosphodiesterase [Lachnospiraceae bacterium]
MDDLKKRIEELEAENARLAESEKMYRLVLDASDSAFIYHSLTDGRIRTIGNWDYFFAFELKTVEDYAHIFDCVDLGYAIALREIVHLEQTGLDSDAAVIRLSDGKTWVECQACIIYDEQQVATDKIIRFSDVTKIKKANEELSYMAYYDMLTGLYNRNYFVRLLGDFVRDAEKYGDIVAVLFINIDGFKKLCDTYGADIGDEIVQQLGQFLADFRSDHMVVSHFEADSFCLAIYDPFGYRNVESIVHAIHDRLLWPFYVSDQQEVTLTVSTGVAQYPDAASTTLELINCAEIVMFKAKALGPGSVQYFDVAILNEYLQKASLESKLREAVFNQNFFLHFQPQYYLEDQKLRGIEALIRWRDLEGHMISPVEFIPIAEKNGCIIPIGAWVLEESIRIYAGWRKIYKHPLFLSINISGVQYIQADFVDNVLATVKKFAVAPEEIELEINESVLVNDFKEITEKLHILRSHGIRITLEDFGTGYSSISYLRELPITALKIDRSFIAAVLNDTNTRVIADSLVAMVKKLGYETVAEGVETKEQYDYLCSIGCDSIQGYFMNHPMPPEEIEEKILGSK